MPRQTADLEKQDKPSPVRIGRIDYIERNTWYCARRIKNIVASSEFNIQSGKKKNSIVSQHGAPTVAQNY